MRLVSLRINDPQTFTIVALLLIVAMVVATGLAESAFYRSAILARESELVHDMAKASIIEEAQEENLSLWDLEHYSEESARARLEHTFGSFQNLPGFFRVKVYDRDGRIAWSDAPGLIGSKIVHNPEDLARAIAGEARAVFNRAAISTDPPDLLPPVPSIEFYVPFSLAAASSAGDAVAGVLSIYRSPDAINRTIRTGLLLLWSVTGAGGLILYVALYRLFRSVYRSRGEIQSKFIKLSAEFEDTMQVEKLSAMGQMVSEIAHQLNNPLVGVINLAELAERELDNRPRVKELLGEVRKAGEQCRSFVQSMLRISQVARAEPQATDMNELARETIAFFQHSLGGHPGVTLDAATQPIMAEVDPVLIRNALFNLIHNAAQAGPAGPVVVSVAPEKRDGIPGCRLTVSDRGPGLAPEVAAKLFTPFFTTRPNGTGLGLSIAQHIAIQHGGAVWAENRAGGGASFSIWLPAERQGA
jgi:signal transduction histidine kinase